MKKKVGDKEWKKLVNITKKAAIKKYGNYFRREMIASTGINKNIIGRFFAKKEKSKFETIVAILDDLDLKLSVTEQIKKEK